MFYQEIFNYYNECKKTIDVSNLSDIKFAQQPLWINNLFQYKGQIQHCFKNLIASNLLYIKDVFY